MLEIFAIAYFIRQIKKVALQKGLKPNKWIAATIVSWFALEIIVFVIAFTVFNINDDSILIIMLPAILTAAASAFLILQHLKKQPQKAATEINLIGKE